MDLMPFIEKASCPLKALRYGEGMRDLLTADFKCDPLPKQVLVTGATGKSGGIVTKMFQTRGYKVVAVGRRDQSDARVCNLIDAGVEYRKFSETPGFAQALRKEFGEFAFLFDLTGNSRWLDVLQPAVGNTGGVLMYAIPACSQTSSHDLNLASRDLVLANKFRFGSVNAGRQDWNAAVHLISRIAKEDPEFLLSRITQIEGLDLEKINWAIEDPSVECPVVCLN